MRLNKLAPVSAAEPSQPRPAVRDELDLQVHSLQNTLASLKLRLGILAADPTCQFAHEDNLAALFRLVESAMEEAGTIHATASARRSARQRTTGC